VAGAHRASGVVVKINSAAAMGGGGGGGDDDSDPHEDGEEEMSLSAILADASLFKAAQQA